MRKTIITFGVLLALTGMALAHADTKDPTVKAWMANMKAIGAETKTLGLMTRGQNAFDAEVANTALARIAVLSEAIPALFAVRADDPTSEARDLIWRNWDGYQAEAVDLMRFATTANIMKPEDLRLIFKDLGHICKSCHSKYQN